MSLALAMKHTLSAEDVAELQPLLNDVHTQDVFQLRETAMSNADPDDDVMRSLFIGMVTSMVDVMMIGHVGIGAPLDDNMDDAMAPDLGALADRFLRPISLLAANLMYLPRFLTAVNLLNLVQLFAQHAVDIGEILDMTNCTVELFDMLIEWGVEEIQARHLIEQLGDGGVLPGHNLVEVDALCYLSFPESTGLFAAGLCPCEFPLPRRLAEELIICYGGLSGAFDAVHQHGPLLDDHVVLKGLEPNFDEPLYDMEEIVEPFGWQPPPEEPVGASTAAEPVQEESGATDEVRADKRPRHEKEQAAAAGTETEQEETLAAAAAAAAAAAPAPPLPPAPPPRSVTPPPPPAPVPSPSAPAVPPPSGAAGHVPMLGDLAAALSSMDMSETEAGRRRGAKYGGSEAPTAKPLPDTPEVKVRGADGFDTPFGFLPCSNLLPSAPQRPWNHKDMEKALSWWSERLSQLLRIHGVASRKVGAERVSNVPLPALSPCALLLHRQQLCPYPSPHTHGCGFPAQVMLADLVREWHRAYPKVPMPASFLSLQMRMVFGGKHPPGTAMWLMIHMCALALADMCNQKTAPTTLLCRALCKALGLDYAEWQGRMTVLLENLVWQCCTWLAGSRFTCSTCTSRSRGL